MRSRLAFSHSHARIRLSLPDSIIVHYPPSRQNTTVVECPQRGERPWGLFILLVLRYRPVHGLLARQVQRYPDGISRRIVCGV